MLTENETRACTEVEKAVLLIGNAGLGFNRHAISIEIDAEEGPPAKEYPSLYAFLTEHGKSVSEDDCQIVERLLREVGRDNYVNIRMDGVDMAPAAWSGDEYVPRDHKDDVDGSKTYCLAPCIQQALHQD